MHCVECGTENPTGKKFCSQCGCDLFYRCNKCGSENLRVSKFCGDCGEEQHPKAHEGDHSAKGEHLPAGGEKRHLTVLFSDLVDSTAIAARLGPEEWHI